MPYLDHKYWVSCYKFTIGVTVNNGTIVDAAPIVRNFIGQPFSNLEQWMKKLGGYRKVDLSKVKIHPSPRRKFSKH